jgi:LPXTG-motif cell wall-anchored protein
MIASAIDFSFRPASLQDKITLTILGALIAAGIGYFVFRK